jgi:hypothetical protein
VIATTTNLRTAVNGAIELSLNDRGNMRIWALIACGATLVGDRGRYPDHLNQGSLFAGYAMVTVLLKSVSSLQQLIIVIFQFLKLAINRSFQFNSKHSQLAAFERFIA